MDIKKLGTIAYMLVMVFYGVYSMILRYFMNNHTHFYTFFGDFIFPSYFLFFLEIANIFFLFLLVFKRTQSSVISVRTTWTWQTITRNPSLLGSRHLWILAQLDILRYSCGIGVAHQLDAIAHHQHTLLPTNPCTHTHAIPQRLQRDAVQYLLLPHKNSNFLKVTQKSSQ